LAANAPESNADQFCWAIKRSLIVLLLSCKPENENTEDENNDEAAARWEGLDSEVDTEEEVEVAIRCFPDVLKGRVPRARRHYYRILHGYFPIFHVMSCLRALPFVPLLAELGDTFCTFRSEERGGGLLVHVANRIWSPLEELFWNRMLWSETRNYDEEYGRQLDEVSLSVLLRLKEKGLMRKEDVGPCVSEVLCVKPFRTERRFRFLLDWDPTVLKGLGPGCSLLRDFLKREPDNPVREDDELKRFQTIFELGMSHYPKDIGFMFDTPDRESIYDSDSTLKIACDKFGKEKVTMIVDAMILKSTLRRCDAIRTLVFTAATNTNIRSDGLYFFIRLDPTALFP